MVFRLAFTAAPLPFPSVGVMVMAGTLLYPAPGLVSVTLVTPEGSSKMVAVAVAPDPGPLNDTVGT